MRSRLLFALALLAAACGGGALTEIQHVKSGSLDVVLLSPTGAIKHGQDTCVIEFRNADGTLVDVGDVKADSTMPMPGSPMFGSLEIRKTTTPGRYDVAASHDMAGTWRMTFRWDGPAGTGSASFSENVR